MGFLPQLLTAVALQTLAQLGLVQGEASALWGLLLMSAPYLFGSLNRRSMLAGRFRRASLFGRLLGIWSVVGFGALVLGTNWLTLLRRWSGSPLDPEAWPEPTLILAFMPFVILQVLCIDAEARMNTRPGAGRRAARGLALRMFLSTATPLAVYLGVLGLVGAHPLARTLVEEVDLCHALFLTLLLVGMSLGGYAAAMMAGLDPDLAFVAVIMAPTSLADGLWQQGHGSPARLEAEQAGFTLDDLRHIWAIHCPLVLPRLIPRGRLLLMWARADHVIPRVHMRALWEHWGRPEIRDHSGGHCYSSAGQATWPRSAHGC